ncbi:MAG TPA: hypothetical protein VJU83_02240 [Burkholderiales bacterium]|nr:hypothetical protein [Burkholderiales bacterium]
MDMNPYAPPKSPLRDRDAQALPPSWRRTKWMFFGLALFSTAPIFLFRQFLAAFTLPEILVVLLLSALLIIPPIRGMRTLQPYQHPTWWRALMLLPCVPMIIGSFTGDLRASAVAVTLVSLFAIALSIAAFLIELKHPVKVYSRQGGYLIFRADKV